MPVDYLFIVPLSPSHLLTEQRKQLQDLCFNQIEKLRSTKRVWLLGEGETNRKDFEVLDLGGKSKEDKLFYLGQYLEKLDELPAKYLVRLDDDDLINPLVFDQLSAESFDVAFDQDHCFYDLSSGLASTQKRPWIANTCIHKIECALQLVEKMGGSDLAEGENYLMASDHSQAWHRFYANRRKVVTKIGEPLYIRVLNDESITAKAGNTENSKEKYYRYLTTFGSWDSKFPLESDVLDSLTELGSAEGVLEDWKFDKPTLIERIKRKVGTKRNS